MLTEIVPADPPIPVELRPPGPSTPLDVAILAALADGQPHRLREVARATGDTSHHVHARAQVLVERGLLLWLRPEGGPTRGPGASHYQLAGS